MFNLRKGLIGLSWAFGLGWSSLSFAETVDFTIHQDYLSTRAIGFGNAYSALADDYSALFYNPAGLARREKGNLKFFLRGGLDPEVLDFVDDIDKASKGDNETEKVNQMVDLIEENYGEHYSFRAPTLGAFYVRPKWGIAFIPIDAEVNLGIHQLIGPSIDVNAYTDSTLAFGYGRNYKVSRTRKHVFSVGATAKAIHRIYFSKNIPAVELIEDNELVKNDEAREGLALDLDLGVMFTPEPPERGFFKFFKYIQPTFAAVVRNAIDSGFIANFHLIDKNSQKPPELQRRVDLGMRLELPELWVFKNRFMFDLRDMTHDQWTLRKGFHAGAEFNWTMYNWWKGHWAVGLNQGYVTAGFGAMMGWFELELATWGEEVGTSKEKKEDRRVMAQLSLDF